MNQFLLLGFVILGFLPSYANSQQNYSKNSALDCDASDKTGPSSAFLYTCNGQNRSCKAFLIIKSQPSFHSVPAVSTLTSANQEELARINNVTRLSEFRENKEVIVPVNCFCLGQYYQANTTIQVTTARPTYYAIANHTYEGLSTCAALKRANAQSEYNNLVPGEELLVPLRCACPTMNQTLSGTRYLLTYPLSPDDNIPDIADRFNVSTESILDANGMEGNPTLFPDTTILIPLPALPTSSQTVIHSNLDPPSPPASSPGNKRPKKNMYESAVLAAGCSLLLLSIIIVFALLSRKRRRENVPENGSERKQVVPEDLRVEIASYEQVLKVFEFEELKKATEGFSSKGRIKGSVYRGEFGSDILAVKKMSRDVTKEVDILKRINHFNLIKLEGVCNNHGCFYLVFEHMENGSLKEWLSCKKTEEAGNWTRRIQIALDVANGLHYLHSFTKPAYVHQDIKSSNVLLNGNLRAKIANFSLARVAIKEIANAALTKHVVGTRGYMAPEYVEEGLVTPKIDVYAFGVILLELITGKVAVFARDGREALLSTEIISIMEKQNSETELNCFIDPGLRGSCGTNFALRLAKVGTACLAKEPARRPSMEELVSILLKFQADVLKS